MSVNIGEKMKNITMYDVIHKYRNSAIIAGDHLVKQGHNSRTEKVV
jgi:hypothetical protein